MGLRLALETTAARGIGALSRAVGRGGGTTLPGKVLWKVHPSGRRRPRGAHSGRRGAHVGHERKDDDDCDGRRDPRRRHTPRMEPRRREPALRDHLRTRERPPSRAGPLRGRRGCTSRGAHAAATAGRDARESLPRPARPLRRARDRGRALESGDRRASCDGHARRERRRSDRGRSRRRSRARASLRARRPAPVSIGSAARCGLEVLRALRSALRVRRGVRRPSRRLPLPAVRAPATAARRRRAARSSCVDSSRRASASSHLPARRRSSSRSPASTTSTTR